MATEVITPASLPVPTVPFPSAMTIENDQGGSSATTAPAGYKDTRPERIQFDASKHLEYTPPSKTYSMKELGYQEGEGVSPIGVSEPFPLFSAEAIGEMRREILSEKVWSKYKYSSNLAHCQLRGFAPEYV